MLLRVRFSEPEHQARTAFRAHREQIVAAVRRDGFVILENFLSRRLVEALAVACQQRMAGWPDPASAGVPVGDRRRMYLQALESPYDDPRIYANSLILPALADLLGPNCVISTHSLVVALPGAAAQQMHRDNALPFDTDPASGVIPPLALNLAIPLLDLDATTGTTAVHVGSHHKLRPTSTFGFENAEQAWLRKGDAYLMDYRLVHAGLPNMGVLPRPMIYLIYARHWYLDAENHLDQGQDYLHVPEALWRRLTPEQSRLLSRARLRVVAQGGGA